MSKSNVLLEHSYFLSDTTHTSKFDFMIFSNTPYLLNDFEKQLCNYIKEQGHRIYHFYTGNSEESFTIIDENHICISVEPLLNNTKTRSFKNFFDLFVKKENIRCAVFYICTTDFNELSPFLINSYGFFNVSDISSEINTKECYSNILKRFPLASIIILTYNNLDYTKECINSILKYTEYPNYEIIIVDNASYDDTPIYLQALEKEHKNIRVYLNNENSGFAKGNNIGLNMCLGDYIVFLNNDTVVTKGWLYNLIKYYFKFGNSYGIIGPVTNCICTKAKIQTSYTNLEEMHSFAEKYVFNNLNRIDNKVSMLAMFCTIITREIFNSIGFLDENFELGNFEDDDYCHRALQCGYKLAIVHDVFIHHKGSATMNSLNKVQVRSAWNKNKKYFEAKWKTKWRPHNF